MDTLTEPERDVVIRHLLVSAQILASGGTTSTCLIHPSVKQTVHQKFADSIKAELDWCKANLTGDLATELRKQHTLLTPTKSNAVPFSEIMNKVTGLLNNNEIKVLVMNGKTDPYDTLIEELNKRGYAVEKRRYKYENSKGTYYI